MELVRTFVPWWNGYETLLITEPYTEAENRGEIIMWVRENSPTMYLPIPFKGFSSACPPWRHNPEKRWDMAMASLHPKYQIKDRSFIDFGGNTGYYTFLAKAVGCEYVVLVDSDEKVTELAQRINTLYEMGVVIKTGSMEEYKFQHCDIAFCFSALPYVGGPDKCKELLKYWSERVDILFMEMGDGGSQMEDIVTQEEQFDLFLECGWQPTLLGENFASHTNTFRPLWKLEALRLLNHIDPFLPMGNATQSKCYRDGNGRVLKDMSGGNIDEVTRELHFHNRAYAVLPDQVARPINQIDHFLLMEDLGDTEPITDMFKVLESAEMLLDGLREARIVHGDLDPPNLIIQDNVIKVVDFGWSQAASGDIANLDRQRLMKAIYDIARC